MRGPVAARNLAPGMVIRIGKGQSATVVSVQYCDGQNGTELRLIGDGDNKTACAVKVTITEGKTIYVHPGYMFAADQGMTLSKRDQRFAYVLIVAGVICFLILQAVFR